MLFSFLSDSFIHRHWRYRVHRSFLFGPSVTFGALKHAGLFNTVRPFSCVVSRHGPGFLQVVFDHDPHEVPEVGLVGPVELIGGF